MSSNKRTVKSNTDEFGRDLSLRYTKEYKSIFGDYLARFQGMSWADITYLQEEEEERAKKNVELEEYRKTLLARKELHKKGLYELEEGEELEL